MKTKKLIKKAFKRPELHTWADLIFFREWLKARKKRKEEQKKKQVK